MQFKDSEKTILVPTPSTENINSWTSEQLFGSSVAVNILHEGVTYRLAKTRQNKLILTKTV